LDHFGELIANFFLVVSPVFKTGNPYLHHMQLRNHVVANHLAHLSARSRSRIDGTRTAASRPYDRRN